MRALYLSHIGLSEPLGRSQIVPYLVGVARAGWGIDAIAFEPHGANPIAVAEELADYGIRYQWIQRSPSHHLGVKLLESARGFLSAVRRTLLAHPRVIHARTHLPAAVGMAVRLVTPGSRLLFDCRGLVGDEYVEWGHWSRESREYRLLKAAERQLFGRADGVVVLTNRMRRWLHEEARFVDERRPIEVIPCCVDLDRFTFDPVQRAASRRELGVGDRFVLAYSGSLGSCYCDEQMAELFAGLRRRRQATFAVFTRCSTDRLRAALRAHGVADEDLLVRPAAPHEMPSLLCAADAAVSFIEPLFSKMASSPTKLAEYLAIGLSVATNEGVGDQDAVMRDYPDLLLNAGRLSSSEIDRVATELAGLPPPDRAHRQKARALAERNFALSTAVERYRRIYERVAS